MDPLDRDLDLDLDRVRERVDEVLFAELERARGEMSRTVAEGSVLVDELERLVRAGGKRLRPLLCVLGHVAADGRVDEVLPAAAGLELFHTFALVHDDIMDDDDERRGVQTTHRRFAEDHPRGEEFGRAVGILVGDAGLALATDLLLSSPLPADRLVAAAHRMRSMALLTAAGQYLDVAGAAAGPALSALKTAAYTAEGPLAIGGILAGAGAAVLETLERFGRPLGVGFQILDDLADGSAPPGDAAEARRLFDEAEAALTGAPIDRAASDGLRAVVARLRGAV